LNWFNALPMCANGCFLSALKESLGDLSCFLTTNDGASQNEQE